MIDTKNPLQSKTILSGIATIVIGAAPLISAMSKGGVSAVEVTDLVNAALLLATGILGIYGRYTAKSRISA
jgi:hypothetical protein